MEIEASGLGLRVDRLSGPCSKASCMDAVAERRREKQVTAGKHGSTGRARNVRRKERKLVEGNHALRAPYAPAPALLFAFP